MVDEYEIKHKKSKKAHGIHFIEWLAPEYPYKERSVYDLRQGILRLFIVILVMLFFKQFALAIALVMLVGLMYLTFNIPPRVIDHEINTNGVISHGKLYIWEDIAGFMLAEVYGQEVMYVYTVGTHPVRLVLVLEPTLKEDIQDFMERYVPYRGYFKPGRTENLENFFARFIGLD